LTNGPYSQLFGLANLGHGVSGAGRSWRGGSAPLVFVRATQIAAGAPPKDKKENLAVRVNVLPFLILKMKRSLLPQKGRHNRAAF
jgi:hypothetical protein